MTTPLAAMNRRVVLATHGHCFDGAASAALFSRLLTQLEGQGLTFDIRACGYGPAQGPVGASVLNGDINAVLDFRYTQEPTLHWYFDHHGTAFQSPGDREHFEARQPERRRFHDPGYGSCTRLIADIGAREFGFEEPLLKPLVHWADIIDAARFESASQAVVRKEPELQLMTVIEHCGDSTMLNRLVPRLASEPLHQVALDPEIQQLWKGLEGQHLAFIERVQSKSVHEGTVVFVDLSDKVHDVVGKFVTYALFPQSTYSVILSRSRSKFKISVGYNPWAEQSRGHDIGAICAAFGGGGHPVVGAASFSLAQADQAQAAARSIVSTLAS